MFRKVYPVVILVKCAKCISPLPVADLQWLKTAGKMGNWLVGYLYTYHDECRQFSQVYKIRLLIKISFEKN